MSRKRPKARLLCPKPSSEKEVSTRGQSHPKRKREQPNARISLISNEDGTYSVHIVADKLVLHKRKQGNVFVLADIDQWVPVEVVVGNMAFYPRLILKLQRRINGENRFKMNREMIKELIKRPTLI